MATNRLEIIWGAGEPAPSVTRPNNSEAVRKPNFILIYADNLGYADWGCYVSDMGLLWAVYGECRLR